jgi:hypothetical protein
MSRRLGRHSCWPKSEDWMALSFLSIEKARSSLIERPGCAKGAIHFDVTGRRVAQRVLLGRLADL